MSLLKQIDDKGAVLEWSPVASQPNLVALGTQVKFHNIPNYYSFTIQCTYIIVGFCWIWFR
jgi:hypothetical protein